MLPGSFSNNQSLNRYAYVQENPVNYTDPFGLNPVKIIKSYSGVLHDVLNVASIVPGPVGAVTGMINAGLYGLEGNYSAAAKCAVQAGLTAFVGPLAGATVGGLCKLSKTARVITSIAAIGAGMYSVGTSAYDLYDNSMDLVDAITSEKGASASEIFHYFSNMIVSIAGVSYGVIGVAGGIGGLTHNCFVAGTKVKTEDGDKNIEDIDVGGKVYSCDPETGETGLKEVKQTFVNETDTIVHLEISDDDKTDVVKIDATEKHPFYVVDYGFKNASELKVGDKVKLLSGDIYEISDTSIEYLAEPIKVYNFEVNDWHTYYVTSEGILVHNMCKTSPNASDNSSDKASDTVKAQETTAVATAETPVSEGGSEVVDVKLSRKKYPESAQHIEEAIKEGQPDILTIDRRGASSRRKASLQGVNTVPGLDRDEYPPAMSKEGGTGASVKLINPSDNRGSGSSISGKLRKYSNGTKYRIIITDEE